MSAMNVWVTYDTIAITTDTYCHRKDYGLEFPINFVSKIYQAPQHKSCFTNQGLRDLGMRYFEFVTKEVKAKDVSSLIDYSKKHFNISDFYPEIAPDKLGTIFIFGFNDTVKRFEVFKIYFDNLRKIVVEQICETITSCLVIYKPQPNRIDISAIGDQLDWTNLSNAVGSLVEIMKVQKEQDDLDSQSEKVGIGGQIQLTILNNDSDYFTIQSSIIYTFPDYEKLYALMP